MVATSKAAASNLGEQFKYRKIVKEYIGFCQGIPRGSSGFRYSGTLISTLDFSIEEKK